MSQRHLSSLNSSFFAAASITSNQACALGRPPRVGTCSLLLRQNSSLCLSKARVTATQAGNQISTQLPPSKSYLQALINAPLKNPSPPVGPLPQRSIKSFEGAAFVNLAQPTKGKTVGSHSGANRAYGMVTHPKRGNLLLLYLNQMVAANHLIFLYVL
jgi:hypothetical protein